MSNQIKAANFYILVALFLSGCAGSGGKMYLNLCL